MRSGQNSDTLAKVELTAFADGLYVDDVKKVRGQE